MRVRSDDSARYPACVSTRTGTTDSSSIVSSHPTRDLSPDSLAVM